MQSSRLKNFPEFCPWTLVYAWAILLSCGQPEKFCKTAPSEKESKDLKPDNLDQDQARMTNWIILEHHFKTLKRVLEANDLLDKHSKIFVTNESRFNMDFRQGKLVVSHGSNQAHSQSKSSMII